MPGREALGGLRFRHGGYRRPARRSSHPFWGDTSRGSEGTGEVDGSLAAWWLWLWGGNPNCGPSLGERTARGDYAIPGGSRKAVLVHLAVATWKSGGYVPKEALPQVRGHDLHPEASGSEDKLVRALARSSMGEIEQVLGPIVRGKLVIVHGHLQGSARTAIEKLGAEVEELVPEDAKRYIDMTPLIFVVAAVAMGARYISLGLDNQELYIMAGLVFALMYGLRPFFFKMQRPQGS